MSIIHYIAQEGAYVHKAYKIIFIQKCAVYGIVRIRIMIGEIRVFVVPLKNSVIILRKHKPRAGCVR